MAARWSSQELSVNDDFTQVNKRQRIRSDPSNPHQVYNCTMSAQQYGISHGLQAIGPSDHHLNPQGHMMRVSGSQCGQHGPCFPQIHSHIGTDGCLAYPQSEQHNSGLARGGFGAPSTHGSHTYGYRPLPTGHNFVANPQYQPFQCLHSPQHNDQNYAQQATDVSFHHSINQHPTDTVTSLTYCDIPIECHYPIHGTFGEHQQKSSQGLTNGNVYDAQEWVHCADLDAICGSGCRVPCDTPPGQCNKPNRCDSPVLDCLEPCPNGSDDCGRQDKCDSVECEAQGFCHSSETDSFFAPIFGENAHSTQGELQGSLDDPFGNSQVTIETDDSLPNSTPSTPVSSSDGRPSINSSYQPGFPSISSSELPDAAFFMGFDLSNLSDVRPKLHANSVEGNQSWQGVKSEQHDEDYPVDITSRSGILINGSPPTPRTCNQGIPISPGQRRKSGKVKVDPCLQPSCELGNGQSMTCQWIVDGSPCGEIYVGNDLNQHWIDRHKPNEKGSVYCKWAGCRCKKIQNNDKLNRHMRCCHTQYIAVRCELCGKCFAEKGNYVQHMQKHDESKQRFKCPYDDCDKDFASQNTRKTHIEQHHLEGKMYICEICGHPSNDASNHRKHMKSEWNLLESSG